MQREKERNSLGQWCSYCKDELYNTDNYIVVKGIYYHVFCWKQKHTFIDPFEDVDE